MITLSRRVRFVLSAVFLSGLLAASQARAAEPVTLPALDRWLFLEADDGYLVGTRVLKHPMPVPVTMGTFRGVNPYDHALTPQLERTLLPALEEIAAATGVSGLQVEGLIVYPPRYDPDLGGIAIFAVDRGYDFLRGSPLAGYGAVVSAGAEVGCHTYQEVPYAARHPSLPEAERDWTLAYSLVEVDPDLPEARYADCLFRALLIALGLHHTERLAFDPTPLSAAERAEALQVLALVYQPDVESGMTRSEFLAVLRARGLLTD
jgi:hypothetical protein